MRRKYLNIAVKYDKVKYKVYHSINKASTMGKPRGSIGETKLKILAILSHNDACQSPSYGYSVWKTLNEQYLSCLGEDGLRNVYHHLQDLQDQNLITNYQNQTLPDKPERQLYHLTDKAQTLKTQYQKYQKLPQTNHPTT